MIPRVLFVGRTRYRLPLPEGPLAQVGRVVGAHGRAGGRERDRERPALPARAAAAARRAGLLHHAAGSWWRASCGRSARTWSSPRARTRRLRPRSPARWRGRGRRSSSRCTATGGSGAATTARGCAACCGPRATRSPAGRSTMPTAIAPCRASRRRSSRIAAGPRSACSPPTPTSAPSRARGFRCRPPVGSMFVGVLERYKNVEGLAAAWRLVRPAGARRRASPRRQRDAHGGCRRTRARGRDVGAPARAGRGRGRLRRVARAAAALGVGGPAADRDRVVPPGSGRRRDAGGRDSRHRRGRRERAARRPRRHGRRSPLRSSACSSRRVSPSGWARAPPPPRPAGSRRPRSTPARVAAVVEAVLG